METRRIKIVVTVPVTHADVLRQAIGDVGGGQIGNYAHCSFSSQGVGRFIPNEHAQPAIGSAHQAESVPEERIEVTCDRSLLLTVVRAIKLAHPYEEVALDIYPLEDVPQV